MKALRILISRSILTLPLALPPKYVALMILLPYRAIRHSDRLLIYRTLQETPLIAASASILLRIYPVIITILILNGATMILLGRELSQETIAAPLMHRARLRVMAIPWYRKMDMVLIRPCRSFPSRKFMLMIYVNIPSSRPSLKVAYITIRFRGLLCRRIRLLLPLSLSRKSSLLGATWNLIRIVARRRIILILSGKHLSPMEKTMKRVIVHL